MNQNLSKNNYCKLSVFLDFFLINIFLLIPATYSSTETETEASASCVNCEFLNSDRLSILSNEDAKQLSELSAVIHSPQENACRFILSEKKLILGKLSDNWGQEMTGTDLLKEELNQIPRPPHPEGKEYSHLATVISSGMGYNDISETINNILPKHNIFTHNLTAKKIKKDRKILRSNSFINIIRDSWNNKEYNALKPLSPPSVLVADVETNSVNQDIQIKASKKFDLILVGSLSPDGLISDTSNSNKEVHILAPDALINTTQWNHTYSFTNNHGASSLVTGSLAGFEWLAGYHPTAEEAKILLKNTAIPTIYSHEKPRTNGAGLLNAYKLGMVGKRLKQKCPIDSCDDLQSKRKRKKCVRENQRQQKVCFQREINNKENYAFNLDPGLTTDIATAFPSCGTQNATDQNNDCTTKERIFKRLRQAVFLNPEKKDLWTYLSCIYKAEGFSQNSEALDRISLALSPKQEIIGTLKKEMASQNARFDFIRPLLSITEESERTQTASQLIQQFPDHTMNVIKKMESEVSVEILTSLQNNTDPSVRRGVAQGANQLERKESAVLLNNLRRDNSPKVRAAVARSSSFLGSRRGAVLLNKLRKDENPEVRMAVADGAGSLGGKRGANILRSFKKDPSPEVRTRAVANASDVSDRIILRNEHTYRKTEGILTRLFKKSGAQAILSADTYHGKRRGSKVVETFYKDPNPKVKQMAARSAYHIGDTRSLQILETLKQDTNYQVREVALNPQARQAWDPPVTYPEDIPPLSDTTIKQELYDLLTDIKTIKNPEDIRNTLDTVFKTTSQSNYLILKFFIQSDSTSEEMKQEISNRLFDAPLINEHRLEIEQLLQESNE